MRQGITESHERDEQGRPHGGETTGNGIAIRWQRGPLGRGEERIAPNGAFVEDVIAAAIGRIEFYQGSEFKCFENELALDALRIAAKILDQRTKNREARQVEGTHKV